MVEGEEKEEEKTWGIRIKKLSTRRKIRLEGGQEQTEKTRDFVLQYTELQVRNYDICVAVASSNIKFH